MGRFSSPVRKRRTGSSETRERFTFSGGAEYLAWKIERHSGHKVELSDWQKRHPVIAGLVLLPQLLWRGTVR